MSGTAIPSADEVPRLQQNTFGSVSTIRDETQLTNRNNNNVSGHNSAAGGANESINNGNKVKRVPKMPGENNSAVRVVIRKIARSKDPSHI